MVNRDEVIITHSKPQQSTATVPDSNEPEVEFTVQVGVTYARGNMKLQALKVELTNTSIHHSIVRQASPRVQEISKVPVDPNA